jgi:phosphatidate phosphatase PAH1
LSACGGTSASDERDDAAGKAEFKYCRGREFTPLPVQDWRHTSTLITLAAGNANHSAQDVVAPPPALTALPAKFAYGISSSDLEDEDVRVFLDDCNGGWEDLGVHATDSDGRIRADIAHALEPGVYEARFQVLGDQTLTTSYLWVLPSETRIVVSDIDGTLTASDTELFLQILDGTHVPVPYPGAVDLTLAHAEREWLVLYLTGRPYWLAERTRAWLRDLAFSPGPLHVTDSNEEALPSESGVGNFKLAYLESLLEMGYVIDFAYGNAVTDVYAYLGADIPAEDVWIIGENGGQQQTHAVIDSWQMRADEVRTLPAVTQPFR